MFKNFFKEMREMLFSNLGVRVRAISLGYIITGFFLGLDFGFEKGLACGLKMGLGVGIGGSMIMLGIASLVWFWDKPAKNDC
jgi:hypothetical protein